MFIKNEFHIYSNEQFIFENLEKLTIENNALTLLDLSNNRNLKKLNISKNTKLKKLILDEKYEFYKSFESDFKHDIDLKIIYKYQIKI